MNIIDRFLKYVSIDTSSMEDRECIPSTENQLELAKLLLSELHELGVDNAYMTPNGYVYAHIEGNIEEAPALGFVAHMDTSPDAPGNNIRARIHKNYDGSDITLSEGITMSTSDFPSLKNCIGCDLIVTDGTTLLGADDKAGVAEIMTLVETIMSDSSIPHGKICIAFTPDEEVGRGTDMFDVSAFGADYAYTVDGGELGELEYENFNAASARILIHGLGIHPGSAKNRMINSIHVAYEFNSMLPSNQRPEYTEGYEGFIHLNDINGDIETTRLSYIIRDHDMEKFVAKKDLMLKAAEYINMRYGSGTLEIDIRDSYYNMREKIEPNMFMIDVAREAMLEADVQPIIVPVRGGTDGARLSYMGLPCPNLCTGGMNFHGRFEYIPVQSMEKVCVILQNIVKRFSQQRKA